jgi:hypothetical protein
MIGDTQFVAVSQHFSIHNMFCHRDDAPEVTISVRRCEVLFCSENLLPVTCRILSRVI